MLRNKNETLVKLHCFCYFYLQMNNDLGKEQRLKGKKAVSEIFEGPKKSVHSFPFRAFYTVNVSKSPLAQFGISVPKKKFKRAVDRNRIKRLVKEAVRVNKAELYEVLGNRNTSIKVMVVCNANEMPNYNLVEVKIKEILKRLAQVINAYEEK